METTEVYHLIVGLIKKQQAQLENLMGIILKCNYIERV